MSASTTAMPDTQAPRRRSRSARAALARRCAELIRGRRSIRRYQPQPVPQAARAGPAGGRALGAFGAQSPAVALLCRDVDAAKAELSRRMSEQWQQDLGADGADPEWIARRIAISHARLTGSPVLIVPCVTMEDMDVYPDVQRNQAEYVMAVQSVALACQNLLLAAHDLGLGRIVALRTFVCARTRARGARPARPLAAAGNSDGRLPGRAAKKRTAPRWPVTVE